MPGLRQTVRRLVKNDGETRWLVDLWTLCGPVRAEQVQGLLASLPGVRSVRVFLDVEQAEVVLAEGRSVFPEDAVRRLRAAGYWVQASQVPDPTEDSDYARYYHAPADSSAARWVD